MLMTMFTKPAGANTGYQLVVTYTNGSIISGPLSFGLSTLPTSVTATYTLGPGTPGTEPGEADEIDFNEEDGEINNRDLSIPICFILAARLPHTWRPAAVSRSYPFYISIVPDAGSIPFNDNCQGYSL